MRGAAFYAALVCLVTALGCVRRDGRNVDCKWPPENPVHAPDERHLSADAEFAEDLAIRYADFHDGLHSTNYVSNDRYVTARNACMQSLFRQVATQHGAEVEKVVAALGHNRERVDVAVNLPFAVVYGLGVIFVTRWIGKKYAAGECGWIGMATIALLGFMVAAMLGRAGAEISAGVAEALRLRNGHLSYRAERVWPAAHGGALFAGEVVVFWGVTVVTMLRIRRVGRKTG